MANTTGSEKPQLQPWATDRFLRLPAAIPATSTIFYATQAIMRDASGNLIQCDDTVKGEFLGFLFDIVRTQVDPIDTIQVNGLIGDKMFDLQQPVTFTCLIAAAKAGDEGRKVYWRFNNEVTYGPGATTPVTLTNYNYAGTIWYVKGPTTVVVQPPWVDRYLGSGPVRSNQALSTSTATVTLTKFDVNRTFQLNGASAQTVTLPPVAVCSPGDRITFLYIGATAQVMTLAGSGTDKINGAATSAMATTQYSKVTVETDGTQWFVVG